MKRLLAILILTVAALGAAACTDMDGRDGSTALPTMETLPVSPVPSDLPTEPAASADASTTP